MPQRFLRPGIRTSEKWNRASFYSQSLYIAVLTLVDDFGRYDGRPALLHGECFALRNDVKAQQTAAALKELHQIGLLRLYEVEGKPYLQIEKWNERARSEKSKIPDPPQESAGIRSGSQEKDASLAIASKPSPLHPRHSTNGSAEQSAPLTDSEWLSRLSNDKTYEGIDVSREHGKMINWCKANNKTPTRRRFTNWLNRAEKPMNYGTTQKPNTPSVVNAANSNRNTASQY